MACKSHRKRLKKMFSGGSTKAPDRELQSSIGNAANIGLGAATGNPMMIAQGAIGHLSGIVNTLGDKDASLLEKGLAVSGPVGAIGSSIIGDKRRRKEAEYNDAIGSNAAMFGKQGLFAYGGMLNEFNEGGSHETNPNGGIPQGYAEDGTLNTVEEGETKFEDYIFSDRRTLDKNILFAHNLPESLNGKTYAEASKILSKEQEERPNDSISKRGVENKLKHLMMASEETMPKEETNQFKKGGWIQSAIKKPGSFTRQAKSRDMTPAEFQQAVLANPDKYSSTTVRRANLRKTLVGMHADGGPLGDSLVTSQPFYDEELARQLTQESMAPKMDVFGNNLLSNVTPEQSIMQSGLTRDPLPTPGELYSNRLGSMYGTPTLPSTGTEEPINNTPVVNNSGTSVPSERFSMSPIQGIPASPFSNYLIDNTQGQTIGLAPTQSLSTEGQAALESEGRVSPDRLRAEGLLGDVSLGDVGSALRYTPVAYNLISGLTTRDPERTRLGRLTDTYTPSFIDEEAVTNRILSQSGRARGDIANLSAGNVAAARANLLASNVGTQRALGESYLGLADRNISELSRAQQMERQAALTNLQQQNQEQDIYARDLAAADTQRKAFLSAAFTGLGDIGREESLRPLVEKAYGYNTRGEYTGFRNGGRLTNKQRRLLKI